MIVFCGCTCDTRGARNGAQYQDSIYGKGNRLVNPLMKDKKGYRCTVCGKTTETRVAKEDKKPEAAETKKKK